MSEEQPLEINLSSSGLKTSGCMLNLYRTVVEGYKEKAMPARIIYGVAGHKFIQTMYMTGGHIPTAREEATKVFNSIPRIDDKKSPHLSDLNHMLGVALWTWELCVVKDDEFEILQLDGKPAVEINFSIPYFEDKYVKINWCGTMDRIGKIKGGIFIVPDWKFTSSWSEQEYFKQYEMSRAPRGYVLSLRLMSEMYPDSILGQVGKGVVGARFDGIFIKPSINDVKFARSNVFKYTEQDLAEFRMLLDDKCREISQAVKTGYYPKQGLINGSCEGKWGKCSFWNVCQQPEVIANVLLKRDFNKVPFNPLNYND